jgi:hypothetical protein
VNELSQGHELGVLGAALDTLADVLCHLRAYIVAEGAVHIRTQLIRDLGVTE